VTAFIYGSEIPKTCELGQLVVDLEGSLDRSVHSRGPVDSSIVSHGDEDMAKTISSHWERLAGGPRTS
jgi:hypothetical protein